MKEKDAWIQTYTGKKFYPLDPRKEDIDIIDIAHALSLSCRFVGHCTEFYSVAQHSILVSNHMSSNRELAGLLHDASEVYISDLARPFKLLEINKEYKKIEAIIMEIIYDKFNVKMDEDIEKEIKIIDERALYTEKRDLMVSGIKWVREDYVQPFKDKIKTSFPFQVKKDFLKEFYILTKEKYS